MKWQDSKEAVARALVLRAVDILDQVCFFPPNYS